MKKSIFVTSLLDITIGITEPNWKETTAITTDWKKCSKDSDCAEGFACAKGLFETEEETGSYIGCTYPDICKGNGTWKLRNETFQVFCSDEMKEQAAALPDPEEVVPNDIQLASEWSVACEKNTDCPSFQRCYPFYHQWDDSLIHFDNGVLCMEEVPECNEDPNIMFAL